MSATRIIIDVQPCFDAANKPSLIVGVAKELMNAIKHKAAIIIVEYEGYGKMHEGLQKIIKSYKNSHVVLKYTDDGSAEIAARLKKRKLRSDLLRVCGVNANCCVQATVNGLLLCMPDTKIKVVKDACEWNGKGQYDWQGFTKHKNVRLV
jgi:nicotinamidase-related amidase